MKDNKSCKKLFSYKQDRCELLYCRFELPVLHGLENKDARLFNDYYDKIARCAEKWARGFSQDEIKKEYDRLTAHERKFKMRRYEYYISHRIDEIDDYNLSVTICFRLMKNRIVLKEKEKTDVWDKKHLLMTRRREKKAKQKSERVKIRK